MHARPFAAIVLGAIACYGSDGGPVSRGPHSALFIGNSLTYTNNLPRTFADIAALGGDNFTVQSVAKPNVALIDFFSDDGAALSLIAQGGWEFVVMQQGPTYPGLCADTLTLATQMF